MPFRIVYHHEAAEDLEALPRNIARRVLDAVDGRLSAAPDRYGERLRRSLKGFWKLRVGDVRVVYEILDREVRVYAIMDRRKVYERLESRVRRPWRE